jgi:hypothetical protein
LVIVFLPAATFLLSGVLDLGISLVLSRRNYCLRTYCQDEQH